MDGGYVRVSRSVDFDARPPSGEPWQTFRMSSRLEPVNRKTPKLYPMAIIQSGSPILGLDLSALKQKRSSGGAELQNSAPFSWLTPEFPVVVFERDGSETLWLGSERRMRVDEKIKPRFIALELPRTCS